MSPRRRGRRVVRAYREIGVSAHVASTTMGIWLVAGTAVALHFDAFDLPGSYALGVGWVTGGFAAAVFYILFACE